MSERCAIAVFALQAACVRDVPMACAGPCAAEGSFPAGNLGPFAAFLSMFSARVERRRDKIRGAARNAIVMIPKETQRQMLVTGMCGM